jgi:hypothetical protein
LSGDRGQNMGNLNRVKVGESVVKK